MPAASSMVAFSTRIIGMNIVLSPIVSVRFATERVQSSKELISMPRMVKPKLLMESNTPQIFSLGFCKLKITAVRDPNNLLTLHHHRNALAAAYTQTRQAQMITMVLHGMQ